MLGPAVEDAIEGIAADRTSSASRLARVGLETIALVTIESAGWRRDPNVLKEAARRISEAQPAMAIVHNVVHLFARLVAEGQEPMAVLREIHAELATARERIARTFLKVAPSRGTYVTVSYSDNVLESLRAAHGRSPVAHVYVMESPPMFEGRALGKALSSAEIPTTVVADSAGPSYVKEADAVVVGADSILRDGSLVNKVGTQSLARAATEVGKPLYVVCESLKFDARYDAATWPGAAPLSKGDGRSSHDNLDRIRRDFEVVPGRLITAIVTERGRYTPDVVQTMLSPGRKG
jgi:ribose 1,5-bisphosphate isomerase